MKDLDPYPYPYSKSDQRSKEEARVLSRPLLEEEGLDLRVCWRVLRKRQWQITAFFLAVVLTVALFTFTEPPFYTAETTLLIEQKAPEVIDIQQVISESLGRGDATDYYQTQYKILTSRSLAAKVIWEQGLEEDILAALKKRKGLVARLQARMQGWAEEWEWAQGLFDLLPSSQANGQDPPESNRSSLIDTYNRMLKIEPVEQTRLVKVAFSTPAPELSARLANAHAWAYIRYGIQLRTRASEEAERFLEEKLVGLKKRVAESEAVLSRYRRDKQVISLDDKQNVVIERLADLNRRLTQAEAGKITLEAQVRLIHKRVYDSLPAVINDTLIQSLKGQLTRLQGEYAHLSTQFKLGYPRLAQLKAQIEETRDGLGQEIQKVVKGVELAYLAAEMKERELKAKMEEQKAATLSLKDASVGYSILDWEVNTNRQLYNTVLQRMKEMQIATELRASNIFIIDKADPPLEPSGSFMKRLNLILGVFVGLMGGVGLAFFLEYLDNTLKTPEEMERYLRLPSLGVVPDFVSLKHGPGQAVITEAYGIIRSSILLSQAGEPPRTVLFTSATHGEGKTITALNTAVSFARMDVSVLVIDADLRRPCCHKVLGLENGLGLTEVLVGQRELQEVIRFSELSHLSFVSSGSSPPNPAELIGSKKMRELLVSLQEHFDYIFIDSPPVVPVSETVLLSSIVDGVVLVVDGQNTQRQVVQEARLRLSYAQSKILGVVLNRVNMRNGDYLYADPYLYSHNLGGNEVPHLNTVLGRFDRER